VIHARQSVAPGGNVQKEYGPQTAATQSAAAFSEMNIGLERLMKYRAMPEAALSR